MSEVVAAGPLGLRLLKVTEAAECVGVSRRYLDLLIAKGAGPAVTHVGGCKRIRPDELEAWLSANTDRAEGARA